MFKSELIVTDSTGTNWSLDLNNELPMSLNFNIADVKEPDKRNGSYSKTIELYGTKTNNKFFEFMFEVNIATNKFNVNLKTPCIVYSDSEQVLKGDLRLINVQKIYKNGTEKIVYSCVVLGENKTLFTAISEDKLESLDFSKYNHTFDYASMISTWNNYNQIYGFTTAIPSAGGTGYRYPLINYGFNSFVTSAFDVSWLRPALYEKEYWDAIFASAGKTYTSTFLNDTNDLFCKTIVPNNSETLTLTAAAKANFEFYAGDSGAGSAINVVLGYGGGYGPEWNRGGTWGLGDGNWKFNTDSGGSLPILATSIIQVQEYSQ